MSGRGPTMEIWWQTQSVGRKEKHTWNVLRGSVTGKGYDEAAFHEGWTEQHGDGVPVFNIKNPLNQQGEAFNHPNSPWWETMTTLLTEQTFLEFSHILLAEKTPVQR